LLYIITCKGDLGKTVLFTILVGSEGGVFSVIPLNIRNLIKSRDVRLMLGVDNGVLVSVSVGI